MKTQPAHVVTDETDFWSRGDGFDVTETEGRHVTDGTKTFHAHRQQPARSLRHILGFSVARIHVRPFSMHMEAVKRVKGVSSTAECQRGRRGKTEWYNKAPCVSLCDGARSIFVKGSPGNEEALI